MNHLTEKHFYTLKNGLRVQIVPFSGIKTVTLRFWVFVGSANENQKNNGISHFLEHMIFRGNEKLGDSQVLNIKMEELGGEINAATSFDLTEYWLEYHHNYLEKGIRRFCQFLRYPRFEQIETERSIILEEILADYNEEHRLIDPDSISAMNLWPDHSMGLPIIGKTETVKEISETDLRNWYQEYYQPGNMILGITGDVDPAEILPWIEQEFSGTSFSEQKYYDYAPAAPRPGEQIQLVHDKDNQYSLQWSFPINRLTPEVRANCQLLCRVLDDGSSSRLQRQIREEKGLVYDISAVMSYYENGAVLTIQAQVSLGKLSELIDVLTTLIKELIDNGVEEEELRFSKLRYKAYLDCLNDSAQGVLSERVAPLLHPGVRQLREMLVLVDKLEKKELNQTIEEIFQQKQTCFVLVGPWGKEIKTKIDKKLAPWIESTA